MYSLNAEEGKFTPQREKCQGAHVGPISGYHPRKTTFKTHPKHVFFRYENRP